MECVELPELNKFKYLFPSQMIVRIFRPPTVLYPGRPCWGMVATSLIVVEVCWQNVASWSKR